MFNLSDSQLTALVSNLKALAADSEMSFEDFLFNLVEVCASDADVATSTNGDLDSLDMLDAFIAWYFEC